MTILLKANKDLVISVHTKLYQRENAVEHLYFYCPTEIDKNAMSEFTPTLYYTNQANEAYMEILEWAEESDKDGFYKLILPVTTKITRFAGDVTMYLSFTKQDASTDTSYVMKSGELTIRIDAVQDYFQFVPNDALSAIDNRILELDNEIAKLQATAEAIDVDLPTDLGVDDDDKLHLKNEDGELIGDGIEIYVVKPEGDGDPDGEVVINDVDESDTEPDTMPAFIEI